MCLFRSFSGTVLKLAGTRLFSAVGACRNAVSRVCFISSLRSVEGVYLTAKKVTPWTLRSLATLSAALVLRKQS
ncbi:hypothetical protein BDD21_5242 [Thiocapsa rosea]|uniref:Uncharacterized protein n=1 Tax=Thiocapsa rosea TaxID=69360 RepID=A0A495VIE9_9GAMM|nr:hypothetical protein BDD21_5242 [Thiocapsa rosea]